MTHVGRQTDRQTDMKKLIVALRRSANVPKKLVKSVRSNYQAVNITTVLQEMHRCSVKNNFQQQTCLQMAVNSQNTL